MALHFDIKEKRFKSPPPLPKGEPGKDGIDGKDGLNGKDGKDGRDGLNGINGINGDDGKNGVDGKDGQRGARGIDGVGIATIEQPSEDKIKITLTNGLEETLTLPKQTIFTGSGGGSGAALRELRGNYYTKAEIDALLAGLVDFGDPT